MHDSSVEVLETLYARLVRDLIEPCSEHDFVDNDLFLLSAFFINHTVLSFAIGQDLSRIWRGQGCEVDGQNCGREPDVFTKIEVVGVSLKISVHVGSMWVCGDIWSRRSNKDQLRYIRSSRRIFDRQGETGLFTFAERKVGNGHSLPTEIDLSRLEASCHIRPVLFTNPETSDYDKG